MKKIEVIVEATRTGFSAYTPALPVATTGRDLPALKKNMVDALNLYFEENGRVVSEDALKISLDLPQFFAFYKVINAKALSERIGMNSSLLAQYISGAKKPSAMQARRILEGVQQVGRELMAIQALL